MEGFESFHLKGASSIALLLCIACLLWTAVPVTAQVTDTTCPIHHCATCYPAPLVCGLCMPQHVNSSSGHCLKCPPNCKTCVANGEIAECSACNDGYYPSTDKRSCQECQGRCGTCNSAGQVCDTCASQYGKVNEVTTGYQCRDCSTGCKDCRYTGQCRDCDSNYYLLNGNCYICPGTYCVNCVNSLECLKCADGRYWNGITCTNCISYCKTCKGPGACEECYSGYFLTTDQQECRPTTYCEASSINALTGAGCTSCNRYYRLAPDHTCEQCANIYSSLSSLCSKCRRQDRGLYWSTDQCMYCPANCVSCTSLGTCGTCAKNMVWDTSSGTGVCKACSAVGTMNIGQCALCADFYWSSSCTACPTDRTPSTLTATQCVQCYYPDRGNALVSFTGSICGAVSEKTCQTGAGISQAECTACTGYGWSSGSCQLCDANVATCPTGCPGYIDSTVCRRVICSGALDTSDKCTYCQARKWNGATGSCDAVQCSEPTLIKSEADCWACNRVLVENSATPTNILQWDGSACVWFVRATDCTGTPSTTKCKACPGYFLDTNNDCTPLACPAIEDIVLEEQCEKCGHVWYMGGVTTTGICIAHTCLAQDVNDEIQCKGCRPKTTSWTSNECQATVTNVAVATGCTGSVPEAHNTATACTKVDCTKDLKLALETECNACDNRYWDSTSVCIEFDPHACTSTEKADTAICGKCDGYYVTSGSACAELNPQTCDTGILTTSQQCAACSGQNNAVRYWVSGNKCLSCPEGCVTCSSTSPETCTLCMAGYVWSGTNRKCIRCDLLSTSASSSECGECAGVGRVYISSLCQYCPYRCAACSTTTSCTTCEVGLIWDNGECRDCLYDSSTECTSCASTTRGNFYDSSAKTCNRCPLGCLSCTSLTQCTVCYTGYYMSTALTGEKSCIDCGTVPTLAAATTTEACNTCITGAVVWTGSACESCTVAQCIKCSATTTCDQCASNYYYAGGLCNLCPGNCNDCVDQEGCKGCNAGTFLNTATKTCDGCMSGCSQCVDGTSCLVCNTGRCYDSTIPECLSTTKKCLTCRRLTSLSIHCLTCSSQDFLEVCQVCVESACINCAADPASCTECAAGYYLEAATKLCRVCPGSPNCASCTSASTCTTCATGYYADQGGCQPCASTCRKCSAKDTCSECIYPGTYWVKDTDTGYCTPCLDHCKSCTSSSKCDVCEQEFVLMTDSYNIDMCAKCPEFCRDCNTTMHCQRCMDGYYMEHNNVCETCDRKFAHCTNCSEPFDKENKPRCNKCAKGYALKHDGSACVPVSGSKCAVTGCDWCIDPTRHCETCDNLYSIYHGGKICSKGCLECEGTNCDSVLPSSIATNNSMLGAEYYCWVFTTYASDNKKQLVDTKRTAMALPCKNACRGHHSAYNDECTSCCTEDRCNDFPWQNTGYVWNDACPRRVSVWTGITTLAVLCRLLL